MPRVRLSVAIALCCALAGLFVGAAGAALVQVNGLSLHANGSFEPQALPRAHFAPIEFQGHFAINAQGGGQPPALEQAVIDFDRDGRLGVVGLPTCAAEQVSGLGVAEARAACRGAIVGSGQIEASIALGGGATRVSAPLTIFNGPRLEGKPTAILHTRFAAPVGQTLAITVPIERRPGAFRYRATLDPPPIAGGLGVVTRVAVQIGRRFTASGKRRSYVAARCSDGVLEIHGRFTFSDGTIIDGSVQKACLYLPAPGR